MTASDWFKSSTQQLKASGIKSAHLDSLIILEHTLKISRTNLLVQFDQTINSSQKKILSHYLKLRLQHRPIAYITNTVGFYGFNFHVDDRVLIPRPESEELVTKANLMIYLFYITRVLIDSELDINPKSFKRFELTVADLGAGSGNIGISLSLINPYCRVDLIEKSPQATKVCRLNVVKNNQKNQIFLSDFSKINLSHYDLLVANLPYLPSKLKLNRATSYEPQTALFSGQDGLKDYTKLFQVISKSSNKPLSIILEKIEILDDQLLKLAELNSYRLVIKTKFMFCFLLNYSAQHPVEH